MPHAPVHLLDYRRMCDPHFNSAAYDVVRRQHLHGNVSRETTCSGAQTDPSDALNKLIECLDKLRASETSSERELDSGVVSQASGGCSPREEPKKEEPEEGRKQEMSHTQTRAPPGALFNDASTALCALDTTKGQREGWSMDSDGEPPLDTSSLHEKQESLEEDEENNNDAHFHQCHTEKKDLTSDHQQAHSVCCGEGKNSSSEGFHSHPDSSKGPEDGSTQGTQEASKRASSHSEPRTATRGSDEANDVDDHDLPYRVVRLPFGKVLSTGALQKDIPVKAPAMPPLSLGNPFYYSYCAPQLAQERLSVLSPSLDELSSRDEMFSTDLDDMDLFPGHVYAGGRRPEVTGVEVQKPTLTEGDTVCLRKSRCTTCGLKLPKKTVTSEACSSGAYCCDAQADLDGGAMSEDERDCKACLRNCRKKSPTCRALKCICLQQQAKPKSRRLYCRQRTNQQGQSECQACDRDHPMHKCCEELAALTERSHRHDSREEQHRPYRGNQFIQDWTCFVNSVLPRSLYLYSSLFSMAFKGSPIPSWCVFVFGFSFREEVERR